MPPNIVFLITDQQRYDTISALGFLHVETPNLDRLVNEGTHFTNCFVTAPSCAPSRASLFTGYYPHTTGILKNADNWTRSWVENLSDAGYHCANIGKMHTYPYETPCGFHERHVVENKDRFLEGGQYLDEWDKFLQRGGHKKQKRVEYRKREDYRDRLGAFTWDLPPETHSDYYVGDRAVEWLHNRREKSGEEQKTPFFLEVGFPGPHPPYDPLPEHLDRYKDKIIPLQKIHSEDLENQPESYKGMRVHNTEVDHDSVVHKLEPTEAQRRDQRAHYLANVTMIDDKVGEIIDALEATGQLDNTVIVFTSDHGDCLTDHGHSQKWTMYDTVTRVPLIAWAPGRISSGNRCEALVQLMDIGPSLLEFAEADYPDNMEAISLLPALEGKPFEGREHVFAEQVRDLNYTEGVFQTMIRSKEWKLVHFLDEERGQLFNLRNDPDEFHNLWDDPSHKAVREQLLSELGEWHIRSQLKTSKWADSWR